MSLPATLTIGPYTRLPVVLAPMAGITNKAFRRLCREYGPGGVYVCEMITSRALVERTPASMRLIQHDPDEEVRSVQLYTVDPATVYAAITMLVREDLADHVDLNFGCPVAKVTRKGGGAALPYKRDLFEAIITSAVSALSGSDIPLTIKMRMGIDDDHLTYLDAGRIAANVGVSAIALHARTAAQFYSGNARWDAIARLRDHVPDHIPVLGNGDIWSADDAAAMAKQTGCDGVVVGRGCLGRPWLFADLTAAFAGRTVRVEPTLGQVCDVLMRHVELLIDFYTGDERRACRDIRKHMAWYFKGYPIGGETRAALARVGTAAELDYVCSQMPREHPWPADAAAGPRGRTAGVKKVALPHLWLDSMTLSAEQRSTVAAAEESVSGG